MKRESKKNVQENLWYVLNVTRCFSYADTIFNCMHSLLFYWFGFLLVFGSDWNFRIQFFIWLNCEVMKKRRKNLNNSNNSSCQLNAWPYCRPLYNTSLLIQYFRWVWAWRAANPDIRRFAYRMITVWQLKNTINS